MENKLYAPKEFSEMTGIGKNTLATWRRNGVGPEFIKAEGKNGAILYTFRSLEEWKNKNLKNTINPKVEA